MDPSSSHSKHDIHDGTERAPYDNAENETERYPRVGGGAGSPTGGRKPDDIEREDFEEENRILERRPDRTDGEGEGGDGSVAAAGPVLLEKEDFMQRLLKSNVEEKRHFPKGKLYRAEAMEQCDTESGASSVGSGSFDSTAGGESGLASTSASASASASPSASASTFTSTFNADRLLGLTRAPAPAPAPAQNFENEYCEEEDSDDDVTEDSWCTCLSSPEDDEEDDDPEPEPELEPETPTRKRRLEPLPPQCVKKFCPEGSPCTPASPGSPTSLDSPGSPGPPGPPELRPWLNKFCAWTNGEKLSAISALITRCAAGQVRHMMTAIEPLFQRDFISLLPKELALTVLSYLRPEDLRRAAMTCRYWRFLADDNLLWKEQCRRVGITAVRRGAGAGVGALPRCSSPWKAAYMRQHLIEHNWLHKPVDEPVVMRAHDDHVITCLQFCGNRILSGSDDTTLKVWSAVTGKCLRTLVGHSGGVWSSQMVGHLVISGSTDRTLRVWNAKTGQCLKVLAGHTSTVRCMHLHQNKVVSGSRDATLRVWAVPEGRCLRVLVGHMAAVRCVQFDGRRIVSGAYDYFVKVWDPDTGECLHTLAGHTNRVYSLQFDGVHVVSGSLDTSIRVWDVETGQLKHTLTGHQSLTSGMELHANILVSGNADSTVKVWDIATGHCLHTLSGPHKHQSAVTCLQSSSRFVISSSDDGSVKLWDARSGTFLRDLVRLGSGGAGGVVWRIRAAATRLVCAVGSRNGTEETKLLVLQFGLPEIRIRAAATRLVCAVGSRNGTEETKLLVLQFRLPGKCRRRQ